MLPKYDTHIQILYTDTDSLILLIHTQDLYKDIVNDIDAFFDSSNFSFTNQFGLPIKNKKALGKWKFETGEKVIKCFVGLRAKTYAISVEDGSKITRAKGVSKNLVENYSVELYKNILFNQAIHTDKIVRLRSNNHTVFTECFTKKCLDCDDDKRRILSNGINTVAWGNCLFLEDDGESN